MVEHLELAARTWGQLQSPSTHRDGVKTSKTVPNPSAGLGDFFFFSPLTCPYPQQNSLVLDPIPASSRSVLGGPPVLASLLFAADGDPGRHHSHRGITGISVRTEACASK